MKIVWWGSIIALVLLSAGVEADVAGSGDATELAQLISQLQKQVQSLQGEVAALRSQVQTPPTVTPDVEREIAGLRQEIAGLRAGAGQTANVPQVLPETMTVPAWVSGTQFGGDLRVRWQTDLQNKTDDRNRARIRFRYGIGNQLTDELFAGFRLASGSSADRRANYYELGNSDAGFDKLDVWVDQAYFKYSPEWLRNLTIYAGKFRENWKDKGLLINPEAVGFDGVGESYCYAFDNGLKVDANCAQLIVSEGAGSDADSELYVFDAGITGGMKPVCASGTWGLRGTAYIFDGYNEVEQGATTAILGPNAASGNMGNPRVIVGTADIGRNVNNVPLSLFVQGALNTNNHTEGTDVREQNKFYAVGFGINTLKNPGDWAFDYTWAHMERNAMPLQLVNSDLNVGQQAHFFNLTYRWLAATDLNLWVGIPRALDGDRDSQRIITKVNMTTRF